MKTFETDATVGANGALAVATSPFDAGTRVHVEIRSMDAPVRRRPFVFGLHEGQIWMSDDFDAPLPESFWNSEDTGDAAAR